MPAAALWNKDWSVRPAGKVFAELVSKTWSTNVSGTTDKNGLYETRGFTGEYEIVVRHGGREVKQQAALGNKGTAATVTF